MLHHVVKVEIWSDVVCPWCSIGQRRFDAALRAFPRPVEVEWKSFQLDPHATASPAGGHVQHLTDKYDVSTAEAQQMVDRVTETAAGEGLDFRLDLARGANTFDAHRLLHLAKHRGVQDAAKERLDRAYFSEGRPVDDHETLTRLAVEVGLDEAEVREVLATGRYADDVRADVAEARALGISGVPFFVLDHRYGVSGAQPAALLLQALEQAWSSTAVHVTDGPACNDDDVCAV